MGGKKVILAVDIGTGGARALLFDEELHLLASFRESYSMSYPQPGWSEQDPETVVEAVITVLRMAAAGLPTENSLQAVVFCTQMYSVLAIDASGEPLTASLPWSDTRSTRTAAGIRAQSGSEIIPRLTGCPVQPIYPLSKIAWLRTHLDLPRGTRFVSIKDYVIYRLTGQLLTDWSTASASGLLNIANLHWSDEALAACGLDPHSLAELVPPRHQLHHWLRDIQSRIGILPNVPIVLGGGDAPLANLGIGTLTPESVAINVGTSAAARVVITEPKTDPKGRLWTYLADKGLWVLGGIVGSGGAVYDWLVQRLVLPGHMDDPYTAADALVAEVPAGADGLLCVPYLTGEQSPGWNTAMRGSLVGLDLHHSQGHIIRAGFEGLAFALLRVVQTIEAQQTSIQQAIVTGGLNASPIWLQILANVLGKPVTVPATTEGSARGAAMMGWLAMGIKDGYSSFDIQDAEVVRYAPDSAQHAVYQQVFAMFLNVLDQFQQLYHQEDVHD